MNIINGCWWKGFNLEWLFWIIKWVVQKCNKVRASKFSEQNEVVPNAVSQYTFIPTAKELELLNWSKYKETVENILDNK